MDEEDIDIEFTPGYSSTPENESRKHVLTPLMVDRTSLQTIIYDAILIALTRRGFLYLALPITPCALTFPSLETSCKPLRRRKGQTVLVCDLHLQFMRPEGQKTFFFRPMQKAPTFDSPPVACPSTYTHIW